MSSILESEAYLDGCSDVFLSKMAGFAKTGQSIDLGEWIQWYVDLRLEQWAKCSSDAWQVHF
jgi:hypothetical protein